MSDDLSAGSIVVENIQFHTVTVSAAVPEPTALMLRPVAFATILRRRRRSLAA